MPRANKSGPNPQRVDLNTAAPTGNRDYGSNTEDQAALDAVPVQPAAPARVPGDSGSFNRPTARRGEPITAGAPVGPGPGPEILRLAGQNQTKPTDNAKYAKVRSLAQKTQDPFLISLYQRLSR